MRLMIDPGHGGSDPGAISRGLLEKDIVLDVALRLERLLRYSAIQVELTRRTDTFLPLGMRTLKSKTWAATHFLSIHTNADPDADLPGMPEAQGGEIWTDVRGMDFAKNIAQGMQRELPDEPWRGIKQGNLYVIRHSLVPAVLVELGFIDDSDTNRELRLESTREQLAFALLRGLGSENVGGSNGFPLTDLGTAPADQG